MHARALLALRLLPPAALLLASTSHCLDASAPAPSPPSPYKPLDFSRSQLKHHLLHGSLSGPDKVSSYELSLSEDKRSLRGSVTLGKQLCGHPAFIHGGAIASVLDDTMGVLFLSSGNGTGFTANLNVNYRKPVPAGTRLTVDCAVLRVESSKSGARKVFLSGRLLGGAGAGSSATDPLPAAPIVYAEATALFIVKTVPGLESSEALVASIKGALGI